MSDPTSQSSGDHFLAWLKIVLTWLAGLWGGFNLQGTLQITVLILTAVLTAQQIYIQWRDKIRK